MERQENRAVLAWRRAVSTGLVFNSRLGVYESPPSLVLRSDLWTKCPRSCGYTPGKVTGQRATVKAEMNGLTPALTATRRSAEMGEQGDQSLKVLGRSLSDFGVFLFS